VGFFDEVEKSSNIKNIVEFGTNMVDVAKIVIIDFYTGKVMTTDKENFYSNIALKNAPDLKKKEFRLVYSMELTGYVTYYDLYRYDDLPFSADTPIENERTAVRILKGLGMYLSILRELMVRLEKKLGVELEVYGGIEKKGLKDVEGRNEGFKNKKNVKNGKGEINKMAGEYRRIIGDIEKQIDVEKDNEKLEKLKTLRDKVKKSYEDYKEEFRRNQNNLKKFDD